MRRVLLALCLALLVATSFSLAYVEIPYTLGRTVNESSHILLVEVSRVNKEKGLVIYKKLADLKGKHQGDEIKHNIGKRGFHPREWQTIMDWAEVGKRAVFFHNGGASETCIGTYWYQCYREGEWWGMSHAEPFMLRTFCGDPEKLAQAVTAMLQGKEVIITCMADQNRDQLHHRKGKLHRLKASLRLNDYNARRDFVGWGGEDGEELEYKTITLLAESAPGWKFLSAEAVKNMNQRWIQPDFDDHAWRSGQAPIGYGEEEIAKRRGTIVGEKGEPFVFRRWFDVPAEVLQQKDVTFRMGVASDDSAIVWLNGKLIDQDPAEDHEFSYWNREIDLQIKDLKPGRNLVAVLVKNKKASSDLYFDLEVTGVQVIRKKAPPKKTSQGRLPAPEKILPTQTAGHILSSNVVLPDVPTLLPSGRKEND